MAQAIRSPLKSMVHRDSNASFLPCIFGGREDWVYWGGRTVAVLSSLSGVKGLLMHFKGGLNFKNPPEIKKHILFFNALNGHAVRLRRVEEQITSWTDQSLLHGKLCRSLPAFWYSIFSSSILFLYFFLFLPCSAPFPPCSFFGFIFFPSLHFLSRGSNQDIALSPGLSLNMVNTVDTPLT